ncbi:hypothetical protein [Methylopila sp. M107]|uniref:hypothetical protein n=1 Tax=Methylopila sp. M107 TaxID=1101190 RepID=UPI00036A10BB|nr:hypothetical protein [Methylopila sp. M107]
MGARAVKAIDWTARGCRVALFGSAAAIGVGLVADFGYTVPLEVAIERGLAEAAGPERLAEKANAALDADDVDLARGFADLASELKRPLPAETLKRLAEAEAPAAVAMRNAKGAARGFATGEIDGSASLAGALAADLTVIGDLRDLAREGAKAARGEDHSQLILGLAAAGVAVTAATYATAGGAAPARFGLSVLKAARRAGTMSAEFAADLGRRLVRTGETVGAGAATAGRRVGQTATRNADEAAVGARGLEAISGAATELRAVGAAVGAGETVRLLKYARTVDDLPEIRRFAQKFGTRSRAVAEVMGRASLRAFRTTIRLSEMLLKHLIAALLWFGSLVAGAVSNLAWRGVRLVAARV